MRTVSLIFVALLVSAAFGFSAEGQETSRSAAAASTSPTIDQSLELQSASSPKISPDGKRVVYEVQKTNWEDNSFDRNLWIGDIATGETHALTTAKNPARMRSGRQTESGLRFFPTGLDNSRERRRVRSNCTSSRQMVERGSR